MVYNEQLAGRIRALAKRRRLDEKKMFGGVAFMFNGNMCFGVHKDDLMVRVGPERYEKALALPGARPMEITGRPMKGFVFVSPSRLSNDAALKKWLDMGLDFASSLPRK
jgi:hypothetical protein